jgi:hypothetical protein
MQIDFKLRSNQLYHNNGETQNYSYFDDQMRTTSSSLRSSVGASVASSQGPNPNPTLCRDWGNASSSYVKTSCWVEKKSNSVGRSWKRRYRVVANGRIQFFSKGPESDRASAIVTSVSVQWICSNFATDSALSLSVKAWSAVHLILF